jgi:uncharacterized protein (TIGR00299 family) protein
MRIAYLDCFAGISGDMLLGALLDAGVPAPILEDATAALSLNARLKIGTVDRSGISAKKVDVFEGDTLAEAARHSHDHRPPHSHRHEPGHSHDHNHDHNHDHHSDHDHVHSHEPQHVHDGKKPHVHGRSLTAIRKLIQDAPLADPVKRLAIHAFELLGAAEAKIHNVPVDQIHFHEVGAVDAIVDIVAASAGIHHLGVDAWYSSAVNVGGGTVVCAHGTFPVPAPATADLLRGIPTYSAHVQKELVTPTGAALLRALHASFGQQPGMSVERIGYGAGTRNPQDFPNVLRLSIGETSNIGIAAPPVANGFAHTHTHPHSHDASQSVTVLETALDDLSPQVLAYVTKAALAEGALDVMLTPVIMKKGRPGTLLTVLCNESERPKLERLILSETSTLGIRIRQDKRSCLERSYVVVVTEFGDIRMKIGSLHGEQLNVAPEFEDCRAAAQRYQVPLKSVQQAAMVAYHAVEALQL